MSTTATAATPYHFQSLLRRSLLLKPPQTCSLTKSIAARFEAGVAAEEVLRMACTTATSLQMATATAQEEEGVARTGDSLEDSKLTHEAATRREDPIQLIAMRMCPLVGSVGLTAAAGVTTTAIGLLQMLRYAASASFKFYNINGCS